ncbi:39S ribosomal protein L23, mitochondrial [Geodia barretti]|uniref:Large ribosomal subunit protein uL23m n=1 Tax=Geodia barretti TaxID=519541 RepID=A0AA35XH39_GEOBA|nr:39S ribosomal protein L23, mitochondrial [Geodia barretti]
MRSFCTLTSRVWCAIIGAMATAARKVSSAALSFPRQRIYLCNWYVKLVKPGNELPNNHVQCHVPMQMTKLDIRNYFEKIYSVNVSKVNTRIQLGNDGGTFEFPDMFGNYSREDYL